MMIDARRLTEDFTAAPQIDPEDVPALKAAGFTHIVNNRPDSEVPPSHQADRMAEAAAVAGERLHVSRWVAEVYEELPPILGGGPCAAAVGWTGIRFIIAG